jgi:hypothetical protein
MIKSSSTLSDEIQFIDADKPDSANDPKASGRNGNSVSPLWRPFLYHD